jgi:hypothetical protein
LGIASSTSQTKKSAVGWRSGSQPVSSGPLGFIALSLPALSRPDLAPDSQRGFNDTHRKVIHSPSQAPASWDRNRWIVGAESLYRGFGVGQPPLREKKLLFLKGLAKSTEDLNNK